MISSGAIERDVKMSQSLAPHQLPPFPIQSSVGAADATFTTSIEATSTEHAAEIVAVGGHHRDPTKAVGATAAAGGNKGGRTSSNAAAGAAGARGDNKENKPSRAPVSAKWTDDQLWLLTRAYVNKSQTPKGTGQQTAVFWQSVADAYNQLVTDEKPDYPARTRMSACDLRRMPG